MQTETNNLEQNVSSIKKMKKKCKTQGEEEILEFEKQLMGFSKKTIG